MPSEVICSDKLVEITDDGILFRNYDFHFGSRRVTFSGVDSVVVKEPIWSNGKWRIHGMLDFMTWFPPKETRTDQRRSTLVDGLVRRAKARRARA